LYSNSSINLMPPAGPAAAGHALMQDRDETDFSPQVDVQWRPTDTGMYYFSIRQGFKGGGFDFQLDCPANDPSRDCADDFEFDDEKVTSLELGTKLTFADGAVQLNAALFWSKFEDLQVSTIDSATTTFNVGNAAEAITQGLEADIAWAATDMLTLRANLALLDAFYDSFPDAPCNSEQELSSVCPPGGTQDLKDERLPYAPEVSGGISGEFVWPFGNGLEFIAFARASYTDDFFLVLDLDPNLKQESYTLVDGRLALAGNDRMWEIALTGKNLTDETVTSFGNDGLGGPFFAGSYFRMVDNKRSIALQGTLRF
jgi:outer membrane receptor protein involved in Fe transport